MIQIDAEVPDEVMRQYASQYEFIQPGLRSLMDNSFKDVETTDFYRGLMAGMATAYQFSTLNDSKTVMGSALAVIATKVLHMRSVLADTKTELLATKEPTRKEVLLRAAYDLLKKADEEHFVEQATVITIHYDDAECDGSCLMQDIATELGIERE